MKNRKTYLIFLGLTLVINSCLTSDGTRIDLGDNYTLYIDGKWKAIYPRNGYYQTQIYSLVTDYKFDDKFIIAKQKPDYEHHLSFIESDYSTKFSIYGQFLKDSTSKTFMDETTPFIRHAIKGDSSLYKLLQSKGVTDQNQIEDQEKIKIVLDSVFHSDPFYVRLFSSMENYWIIDKKNNIRYGPFSKAEFDSQCKNRNIRIKFEGKL